MTRIEIETTISRDRAGLLERVAALPADALMRGATASAHDPESHWTPLDHLAHLSAIERNFNAMIRAHVAGSANPVTIMRSEDGAARSMEQIIAAVNKMNEEFIRDQRGKSLAGILALGQAARAETLALMAEFTDEQLASKVPGAPWADGTVGGIIGVNALHGRMHWAAVQAGIAAL